MNWSMAMKQEEICRYGTQPVDNDREAEREHLTALPALDMEHFMYRQGFSDVFHRVAQSRKMYR